MGSTNSESNLNQKLAKFCANMNDLERMSAKFSDFYLELMEQADSKSNVWSKLDANITGAFANASFFWLYLLLKGTDVGNDHPIKDEIGRVRKYMQEYLLLKKDAPKLNITAANNFIRNALWEPGQSQQVNTPPQHEFRPPQRGHGHRGRGRGQGRGGHFYNRQERQQQPNNSNKRRRG